MASTRASLGSRSALIAILLFAFTTEPRGQSGPTAAAVARGTVTGIVVSADAAATPLRKAVVTVSGASLPRAFSAITDDEGRFVVAGVPSGTLTIVATKPGYLAGAYGSTRPGRGAMPFLLSTAGQRRSRSR